MASRYLQGRYKPTYPGKYKGDLKNIVYRSSWEMVAFRFCDNEPSVVAWSSEEVIIPYRGIDGRMHRYFMDLWIVGRQADGSLRKFLVEIKPAAKQLPPRNSPNKRNDVFMKEIAEYQTNQLKWEAARAYAKAHGMEFVIWTEAHLVPSLQKFKPTKARKRPSAGRKLTPRT